ncbi:MAG: molybdenum cofactor biosynthesis protein MoaE [Desulfurococcales archaeon]|nr:molybdenum cofactor biosynthesis protein MoaE [Desulfurococcales archaeon]
MPRVRILLYSVLREIAGRREVVADVSEGSSIEEILRSKLDWVISEAEARGVSVIIMDNTGKRLNPNDRITGDMVIHVMPPMSGGGNVLTGLVEEINPHDLISRIISEFNVFAREGEAGAIVFFVGVVRRINRGHIVRELIYEAAREPAEAKLRSIAEEALSQPGVYGVAIYHYVGVRRPGDATMIIAVAGRGRNETTELLRSIVDRVKHEVPIWKKEVREDGVVHIIGDNKEVPAGEA